MYFPNAKPNLNVKITRDFGNIGLSEYRAVTIFLVEIVKCLIIQQDIDTGNFVLKIIVLIFKFFVLL